MTVTRFDKCRRSASRKLLSALEECVPLTFFSSHLYFSLSLLWYSIQEEIGKEREDRKRRKDRIKGKLYSKKEHGSLFHRPRNFMVESPAAH